MSKNTSPPTAFVTGSSRGIGLGIAEALAKQGFNLVIHGRTRSADLNRAQQKLLLHGVSVEALAFDIADVTEHADALAFISEKYGNIDCLVNNAGVSVHNRADLLDVSLASFDEQIAVNLRGPFFLTQAVSGLMTNTLSDHFRSIITISSSNAEAVAVERGEYCLAKSALSMMTKLFAVRLAADHINTYDVMPGLIETDMTAGAKVKYDKLINKGFSPINRWGKPADIGSVVATLAVGNMSFMTGESLHVDGGLLISRY